MRGSRLNCSSSFVCLAGLRQDFYFFCESAYFLQSSISVQHYMFFLGYFACFFGGHGGLDRAQSINIRSILRVESGEMHQMIVYWWRLTSRNTITWGPEVKQVHHFSTTGICTLLESVVPSYDCVHARGSKRPEQGFSSTRWIVSQAQGSPSEENTTPAIPSNV